MSVTFGFYNSLNGDRKYFTREISRLFNALIKDGIFMHIGTHFEVTEGEGMSVNVGIGLAWFDSTWTLNDAPLPISPEESDLLLTRIDALVLEVDESVGSRTNAIKFIKGTPSAQPKKPTLTNTAEVHQYALAYITIKPGATSITQSDIENNIGMEDCPFVTGILETIDISSLISQWESQFNDWMNGNETEFDEWFEHIKGQLGTDAAGNLQNQIDEISPHIAYLYKAIFSLESWEGEGPYTQTVSLVPVDGGPAVTSKSTLLACEGTDSTLPQETKDAMSGPAGDIAKASKTLGDNTITVTLDSAPDVDVEIYFSIKQGVEPAVPPLDPVYTSGGMKLLWTNPTPSAAFAAQTVNFDSEYDAFIVYMAFSTAANIYRGCNTVLADSDGIHQRLYLINYNGVYSMRQSFVYRDRIEFGTCIDSGGQVGGTTACIPVKIVGVRFA